MITTTREIDIPCEKLRRSRSLRDILLVSRRRFSRRIAHAYPISQRSNDSAKLSGSARNEPAPRALFLLKHHKALRKGDIQSSCRVERKLEKEYELRTNHGVENLQV